MEHSSENQYVIFGLGVETFGIDINKVKEIIVFQETTRLPGSGQLMEGVINLRGNVIPIFNLRQKFGFHDRQRTRDTRIVVVEASETTVGLVVDQVSEVLMIQHDLIEKASGMLTAGLANEFISGVAKMENKLIILLNLDKVISPHLSHAV